MGADSDYGGERGQSTACMREQFWPHPLYGHAHCASMKNRLQSGPMACKINDSSVGK